MASRTPARPAPALRECYTLAAHAPDLQLSGPDTDNADWDTLVADAKGLLAHLMRCETRDVSLHHNTTAGFQRIVTRLQLHFEGVSPVLLLTDQEYPGLVALLDEQWRGPLVMVKTGATVLEGDPDQALRKIELAIQRFKPQVVLLSHVDRSTGLVLADEWLRSIQERSPQAILILDGAQAAGNIDHIAAGATNADFYVFSGHKWLLGRPTLGIVVAQQDRWFVDDPAQGYSTQFGSRGTGSLEVLSSLLSAFEKYPICKLRERAARTVETARRLGVLLDARGLKPLGRLADERQSHKGGPEWIWSGIVSVPLNGALANGQQGEDYTAIEPEPFRNAVFGSETAGPRYVVDMQGLEERPAGAPNSLDTKKEFLIERKQSLCHVVAPYSPHGIARFCVNWEHDEEDLQSLARRIAGGRTSTKQRS